MSDGLREAIAEVLIEIRNRPMLLEMRIDAVLAVLCERATREYDVQWLNDLGEYVDTMVPVMTDFDEAVTIQHRARDMEVRIRERMVWRGSWVPVESETP